MSKITEIENKIQEDGWDSLTLDEQLLLSRHYKKNKLYTEKNKTKYFVHLPKTRAQKVKNIQLLLA